MDGAGLKWPALFLAPQFAAIRGAVLNILLILLIAFVALRYGNILIDKVFQPKEGKKFLEERRIRTLRTLLKSFLRYVVYFAGGAMILGVIMGGQRLQPLLTATAAAAGVAFGFGAQGLVKDVINGFFIIFEDQFAVGDYITISNVSGIVEEIGLRITRLQDFGGEIHVIPNGQITQVTNNSRGHMRAQVDVSIDYKQDVAQAVAVLNQVCSNVGAEMADVIVEGPEVLGMVAARPPEAVIRIIAKTKPMEQWAVERELRRQAKEALEEAGIKPPDPLLYASRQRDKA